jgi:transposase
MKPDSKTDALRRTGALNRNAPRVRDPQFAQGVFFDARDLVQVKYEMLRRVRAEEQSVSAAARGFGFSRFSFYQAQAAFQQSGLPGLLPQKPGPRGRHKLTPKVLAWVQAQLAQDPALPMGELPVRVKQRFGITTHRRTIERALAGSKKKRR